MGKISDALENQRLEEEARRLLAGHLANNLEEAKQIILELEEQKRKSDSLIFYMDSLNVKAIFPNLVDERVYRCSRIRTARVLSGSLGAVSEKNGEGPLALGKLMEFVSKKRDRSCFVARIRDLPYEGFEGVFLSPYSAEEVHSRGNKTFDEFHNLYRIEFQPIKEDYVMGMFAQWGDHPISNGRSLVLSTSHFYSLD